MIADPELVWFLASIELRDALNSGDPWRMVAAYEARWVAALELAALVAE